MNEENSVTEQTAKAGEVTNAQDTLDALGVCVTSENEDGGITVYSESSGKKSTIRNPGQLKIEKLIQLCGEKALKVAEEVGLSAVRAAFAQAAHRARRFSDDSVRRQGIWETKDGSLGIVADRTFCKWNGTELSGPATPLEDDVFHDITSAKWAVDCEQLKHDLESFDREKSREVFERLCRDLSRWIWAPDDPERNAKIARIVAALFVATFIQTVWNWRPQVSVSGESHSGKSTLFDFFRRIFGNLAVGLEKSTPAGLRQALGSSASVCLIDEFENDEYRVRLLDLIKTSGGGGTIRRGTMDQKGTRFLVRHMIWVAAIENGIHRASDVNRFIPLELHKPTEGLARLKLPNREECAEFQRHLLAAAIYHATAAKKLVESLVDSVQLNADARIVENFAVPVAMASLILGEEENAETMLREALTLIPVEREFVSDQNELLATVLESHLRIPGAGIFSVKQCIRSVLADDRSETTKHAALTLHGIRIVVKDRPRVLFGPCLIERFLLKGTPWKGKNLRTILRRIPGAEISQQRFDGPRDRAVVVPVSELEAFWSSPNPVSEPSEVER